MQVHLNYFDALEWQSQVDSSVLMIDLGWCRQEFLRRRWIKAQGHLTHVMMPFFGSEDEVEVEIDYDAEVFRYRNPMRRSQILENPLADIALYTFEIDVWLADLAALIGIDARHLARHRSCLPGHLWHLGDVRIAGTHEFSPVFVARAWKRACQEQARAVLEDPIWPRWGLVLRQFRLMPLPASLPGGHVMRGLDEFIRVDGGQSVFDASAFERVLRGFVTPGAEPEPTQFLQGNRLRLPHLSQSRVLPHKQAEIIKLMWGVDGRPAPELSWAQVKAKVVTGCQSFDDAFGGKAEREELIAMVKRGKYRLRRGA